MPVFLAALPLCRVKKKRVARKLITRHAFGVCAFIIEDIVAIIRLCKAVIGTFLSVTVMGHGVLHFVTLCAAVAAFIAGLSLAAFKLFNIISEGLVDLTGYMDSTIFDFVAYVFNFPFLEKFFAAYYFVFCTIAISFITLSIADFVAKIYPSVVQLIRSMLNFSTGDS